MQPSWYSGLVAPVGTRPLSGGSLTRMAAWTRPLTIVVVNYRHTTVWTGGKNVVRDVRKDCRDSNFAAQVRNFSIDNCGGIVRIEDP